MPRKTILALVVFLPFFGALAAESQRPIPVTKQKRFTKAEVADVQAALRGADPKTYRIVLPRFRDGKVIGSKTYGSLPITEVKRLASLKNVTYVDRGNVQAILSDSGGGAGSHTESQSAGRDVGKRIDTILQNLDKSQYVLIR